MPRVEGEIGTGLLLRVDSVFGQYVAQSFKWIKQNLSIKHFFGNSINAVKSQIWIAVCVYLTVMIARKRLNLPASPQILLNIFEVNMFEKIPLDQVVTDALLSFDDYPIDNQMNWVWLFSDGPLLSF
jgi:hypothetical protein